MPNVRELIAEIEAGVELPAESSILHSSPSGEPSGTDERFNGYGVMGLPFASGHALAMRRFPVTSVGPGYTSVWHRDPEGRWAMYQTGEARQACPRFFGSALTEAAQREIAMEWTGPSSLSIKMGDEITWDVTMSTSPAIGVMNTIGNLMPDAMWRSPAVLKLMGAVAGPLLQAGTLNMTGKAPNGQDFIANPLRIWSIPESTATVNGVDLGPVGPTPEQASLGDFMIPQRGIFAIGRAFFENFDPAKHSAATTQTANA